MGSQEPQDYQESQEDQDRMAFQETLVCLDKKCVFVNMCISVNNVPTNFLESAQ